MATPAQSLPLYRRMWRWRYAIPPEKGGWVWWIGPLVVGMLAAPEVRPALLVVIVAAFAGFCARQPATIALKTLHRPHRRAHLAPALVWTGFYIMVLHGAALFFLLRDESWVVLLAVFCAPVLIAHLWLTWRGRERRQLGLDMAAAMALALTAPAAYWSCGGADGTTAFLVWLLPALQSSASIVHIFLKLDQRQRSTMPQWPVRWREGAMPLAHHAGNVVVAALLAVGGVGNALLVCAFALTLIDGVHAVMWPPVQATPAAIGMRQLAVSTLFMVATGTAMA